MIDILKGNMDDTTVTYLEFGGETEEVIYIFDDIEPVEIHGEYIFFLNNYGAVLINIRLAVCTADFILWPPIEAGERIIEELESGRIPGGGCCICG